ncbi:MAG: metal ABC transporter permease [Sulfuricaulis sp.]|uniref:metal ABC transporter permease n=1 Tax=Sulfuricaulis sp. TaxID=2003553 RepID=UPI0034A5B098
MSFDALDLSILGPAFCAGLLVLATHVPLGQQVLARGIVFIDLAIAQIAGLGVIAADALGWEPRGFGVQIAAVGAALVGALLLTFTEKRWPEVQEALIGVLFVLAACGGILLLANNPHGGEHLRDLLVGQILWVSYRQLLPVALLTAVLLALWFGVGTRLGRIGFYAIFAFAVTASVQLVGIYLVFASLIIPALTGRFQPARRQLIVGYSVGVAGYATGLSASALFDLPSGAVVVCALALIGIVAWALGANGKQNENV